MRHASTRTAGKQTTLRHLWLASLGASVAGPRSALDAAASAARVAEGAAAQARLVARDSRLVLRGAALTLGEKSAPLRAFAQGQITTGFFALLAAFEPASPSVGASRRRRVQRRAARA